MSLVKVIIIILSTTQAVHLLDINCLGCEVRTFQQDENACICDHEAYCNTEKQCKQCGECFDFWDKAINGTKNDILLILKKLIDSYDGSQLDDLLHSINDQIRNNKHAWSTTQSLIETFESLLADTATNINNLEEDLAKKQKLLEIYKPGFVDGNKLTVINDMADRIQLLVKNYSQIEEPKELNATLEDVMAKFQILKQVLDQFDDSYPQLATDPLNLALSLESDIDFLESLIFKHQHLNDMHFKPLDENINLINQDIKTLIELIKEFLKDILTVLKNIEKLEKRAEIVKSDAQDIEKRIKFLLEKEEKFLEMYRLLREEYDYLKEIHNLQDRSQHMNEGMEIIEKAANEIRLLASEVHQELDGAHKKLSYEILRFQNEKFKLESNLNRLEYSQQKFDDLLEDLEQTRREIEEFGDFTPMDELEADVDSMIDKINIYTRKIQEYCIPTSRKLNIL